MNVLMELPKCSVHKETQMILRPLEHQTYEQKLCGVWYDCPEYECHCSVLFESKELQMYLEKGVWE